MSDPYKVYRYEGLPNVLYPYVDYTNCKIVKQNAELLICLVHSFHMTQELVQVYKPVKEDFYIHNLFWADSGSGVILCDSDEGWNMFRPRSGWWIVWPTYHLEGLPVKITWSQYRGQSLWISTMSGTWIVYCTTVAKWKYINMNGKLQKQHSCFLELKIDYLILPILISLSEGKS